MRDEGIGKRLPFSFLKIDFLGRLLYIPVAFPEALTKTFFYHEDTKKNK